MSPSTAARMERPFRSVFRARSQKKRKKSPRSRHPKPSQNPPAPPAPGPSPLHTYTSDFADHIDEQKASTFTVLAAQSDDTSAAPKRIIDNRARNRTFLFVSLGVLLIVLGGGGAYAAYWYVV